MANSYISSPSLGLLVALAIAIHNIPEEFAMAVPIVMVKKKRFLYRAAFLSGLAEPFGAIIGLTATHLYHALNPLFMAFAAGAMVFISVHELLPMAKRYQLSQSDCRKKMLSDSRHICAFLNLPFTGQLSRIIEMLIIFQLKQFSFVDQISDDIPIIVRSL